MVSSMGNTPSRGRRAAITQLSHPTRNELTRAAAYPGAADSTTGERVSQGPGARLRHRRLRILRDLLQDLRHAAAPRYRQPGDRVSLADRSRRPRHHPRQVGTRCPAAPTLAAADRLRPRRAPLAPAPHRPRGRPERLWHPPGAAAGRAAHAVAHAPQAPAALHHAPAGRRRPGRHHVCAVRGRGAPSVSVHGAGRLHATPGRPVLPGAEHQRGARVPGDAPLGVSVPHSAGPDGHHSTVTNWGTGVRRPAPDRAVRLHPFTLA